jgi:phosphoethanolamine N-methyltransferase
MEHQNEYHDSMVAVLELVWGEGFMAPGGEGNVAKMVEGLDLEGRRVLDLSCGLGGPACILAGKYGADVVATDLEPPLIERARESTARTCDIGWRWKVSPMRWRPLEARKRPCAKRASTR